MAPPPAESIEDEIRNEKNPRPLDEDDIALLKTYVHSSLFLSIPLTLICSFLKIFIIVIVLLVCFNSRVLDLTTFRIEL